MGNLRRYRSFRKILLKPTILLGVVILRYYVAQVVCYKGILFLAAHTTGYQQVQQKAVGASIQAILRGHSQMPMSALIGRQLFQLTNSVHCAKS